MIRSMYILLQYNNSNTVPPVLVWTADLDSVKVVAMDACDAAARC